MKSPEWFAFTMMDGTSFILNLSLVVSIKYSEGESCLCINSVGEKMDLIFEKSGEADKIISDLRSAMNLKDMERKK